MADKNTEIKTVADVLALLTGNGTVLRLFNKKFGDAGAKIVAAALPQCKTLTTLNLQYNDIGAEGAKALAAMLPKCTTLTELNMANNELGADGMKALAPILPLCTALKTFDVGFTHFGDEGALALSAVLPPCKTLTTLIITCASFTANGAKALASALPQCMALTTLECICNNLGADGAKFLAAVLPQCMALTTLNISINHISNEGANAIAAVLPHCTALTTLVVDSNSIGVDGTKAIAAVLPHCKALTTLKVDSNNIGVDGAKAIAVVLPQCKALTKLSLSNNDIGDAGAKAFAAVIPVCDSLQSLSLGLSGTSNKITAEGAKAIAAVLPICTTLTTLYFDGNPIGPDGANALAAAVPQCPSLTSLGLYNTGIDDALKKQIEALAAQNKAPDRVELAAAKHAQALASRKAQQAPQPTVAPTASVAKAQPPATPAKASPAAPTPISTTVQPPTSPAATSPWTSLTDPSGKTYYWNQATNETSWTPPPPFSPAPPPGPPPPLPSSSVSPSSTSSLNPTAALAVQVHQLALNSPEAGAAATTSSAQLQTLEGEVRRVQAELAALRASTQSGTTPKPGQATATTTATTAAQLAARDAALLKKTDEQLASLEQRLLTLIGSVATDQNEKVKAVLLYIETKLSAYTPYLDDVLARRATHKRITDSPQHDAYYRGYQEVANATYQAALVIKTDLVALQAQNGKATAASVVSAAGSVLSNLVPVGGTAISLTASVLSFFLGRLGEKEQREQLARLTSAFPNPARWFDLVELAAFQATEAKWATIAALQERAPSSSKVVRAFEKAANYLKIKPAENVYQRVAAEDALAGLEVLMSGGGVYKDDASAIAALVAEACREVATAKAAAPTQAAPPAPSSKMMHQANSAAQNAQAALDKASAFEQAAKAKINQERSVSVRLFSKKEKPGTAVRVNLHLADFKCDVASVLGIRESDIAALRCVRSRDDLAHLDAMDKVVRTDALQDNYIVLVTNAAEEAAHF